MAYGRVSFYDIAYDSNTITLDFTIYDKIAGNEQALKIIKNSYLITVELLQKMQDNLNREVEIFNTQLPNVLKSVFDSEVAEYQKRKDSIDKL